MIHILVWGILNYFITNVLKTIISAVIEQRDHQNLKKKWQTNNADNNRRIIIIGVFTVKDIHLIQSLSMYATHINALYITVTLP